MSFKGKALKNACIVESRYFSLFTLIFSIIMLTISFFAYQHKSEQTSADRQVKCQTNNTHE